MSPDQQCSLTMIYNINNTHLAIYSGAGKWLSGSTYVLTWGVIGRLMVCTNCLPFDLTMFTQFSAIRVSPTCSNQSANWFNKGRAMCYHVYVILRVKDP